MDPHPNYGMEDAQASGNPASSLRVRRHCALGWQSAQAARLPISGSRLSTRSAGSAAVRLGVHCSLARSAMAAAAHVAGGYPDPCSYANCDVVRAARTAQQWDAGQAFRKRVAGRRFKVSTCTVIMEFLGRFNYRVKRFREFQFQGNATRIAQYSNLLNTSRPPMFARRFGAFRTV